MTRPTRERIARSVATSSAIASGRDWRELERMMLDDRRNQMTETDLRAEQVREELKSAQDAAYRGAWGEVDRRLADCRLMLGTMKERDDAPL